MNALGDLGNFDIKGLDLGGLDLGNSFELMEGVTPVKKKKKNALGSLFGGLQSFGGQNNQTTNNETPFGGMLSAISKIPMADNMNLGQYVMGQFLPTPSKGG